jgi:hypothetical protein
VASLALRDVEQQVEAVGVRQAHHRKAGQVIFQPLEVVVVIGAVTSENWSSARMGSGVFFMVRTRRK